MKDRPSSSSRSSFDEENEENGNEENEENEEEEENEENDFGSMNGDAASTSYDDGLDESDPSIVGTILKGIAILKKEKARPTLDRIVSKVRTLNGKLDKETAKKHLKLAVRNGFVFALHSNGHISYFDPAALKHHRNRKLKLKRDIDLTKTIVRVVRELCGTDPHSKDSKDLGEIENFISRTYDVEYMDSDVDLRSLLKDAAKKAVASDLLSIDEHKQYRLGAKALIKDVKDTNGIEESESNSKSNPKTSKVGHCHQSNITNPNP